MSQIREAAVAGMFYPADARELQRVVAGFLQQTAPRGLSPKAIVAPHAGYIYSGSVAASAYAEFAAERDAIRRIVLLGPSHRVSFRGLAASSATAFVTPLGSIAVDQEALRQIADLPQVRVMDRAHVMEHSLEVQLPFLQQVLEAFTLVPLLVGDASPQEVAAVLERLWGGDETRFVISSDLSHYHDYATARQMDQATSRAIAQLRPADIGYDDACGRIPVQGLLHLAQAHRMRAHVLDLRNSGDTAGPKDQVVGYGAYVFEQAN